MSVCRREGAGFGLSRAASRLLSPFIEPNLGKAAGEFSQTLGSDFCKERHQFRLLSHQGWVELKALCKRQVRKTLKWWVTGFPELENETLQYYCCCWRAMRVPFQPRMGSGSSCSF